MEIRNHAVHVSRKATPVEGIVSQREYVTYWAGERFGWFFYRFSGLLLAEHVRAMSHNHRGLQKQLSPSL